MNKLTSALIVATAAANQSLERIFASQDTKVQAMLIDSLQEKVNSAWNSCEDHSTCQTNFCIGGNDDLCDRPRCEVQDDCPLGSYCNGSGEWRRCDRKWCGEWTPCDRGASCLRSWCLEDDYGKEFCAFEGETCEFEGTRWIKYMSNEDPLMFVKEKHTNGVDCTNDVFGDPHHNETKSCYILIDEATQVSEDSESEVTYVSEDTYTETTWETEDSEITDSEYDDDDDILAQLHLAFENARAKMNVDFTSGQLREALKNDRFVQQIVESGAVMNLDQKIRDFILSFDSDITHSEDYSEFDSNDEDYDIVDQEAISFYRKAAGTGSCDSEDEIDEAYTCMEAADAFGFSFVETMTTDDEFFNSGCQWSTWGEFFFNENFDSEEDLGAVCRN